MFQDLEWCDIGVHHVSWALQCIYGYSDEGGDNGDREEWGEWRLLCLLYADDLVLCCESKEDQGQ